MRRWREAVAEALYAPGGFYRRPEGPAGHFRTSAQEPLFAEAVAALARELGLGAVLDVGAGRGELLHGLAAHAPELRLCGVDVVPRPPGLPPGVGWTQPEERTAGDEPVLAVAHEWLDAVPVDAVALAEDGPRVLLVDDDGSEEPGPPADDAELAWLERWWPLAAPGDRAELGGPRDAAWTALLRSLPPGSAALAVDYGSLRAERAAGAFTGGTLRGHRGGRLVPPVPDGSCDITAAVAMDAVRAAGEACGATTLLDTTQREALGRLLAPGGGWARELARAELRDPTGVGAFRWLLQRPAG
ncbi:SAM-dependent MidA family methyltransferase [Motilibacter rhizosphaerae]|uniref:SAM-dependent MidA family methyltransferase n=1 Tax=Motilibacter rhizosphaerae TaxID=598652 RepID=A0A4Q7NAM5_9ACTN|nr:SAM-dependent methyltransferase [Motilibacter rhizosphaerae]RZS79445.1 SAM-dependent MidA family methyltransferase [Motilibacter rhizosphaerae]